MRRSLQNLFSARSTSKRNRNLTQAVIESLESRCLLSSSTVTSQDASPATHLAVASVTTGVFNDAGPYYSIVVDVEDANNNVVTSDNSNVTISLAPNTAGIQASGNLTLQAVNGVATFYDVGIATPGTYQFQATDGTLTGATSSPFTVPSYNVFPPLVLGSPILTFNLDSLRPSIPGAVPSSAVATVKTQDSITVDLTNNTGSTLQGAYILELLASPDGQADDGTPIVTLNENLAPLAAGKTRALHVALGAFPLVTTGNYNIVAEVSGGVAGAGNFGSSAGQVAIAAPFIDLTDSVALTGPTLIKPGQKFSAAVTVTNNGNVPAKGPMAIQLGYSANADGSSATIDATPVTNIDLLPGEHVTLHFSELIPTGTAPGNYFGVASVDSSDTFNESNSANNLAVAPTALTILDPFANILGTFIGPFKDTAGHSKGAAGTMTLDILTEDDTTGLVTGTGTNLLGASFNLTGQIETNGHFIFSTSDISDDITSAISGQFAGGKFTGTFLMTSPTNKGTFTLTVPTPSVTVPLVIQWPPAVIVSPFNWNGPGVDNE